MIIYMLLMMIIVTGFLAKSEFREKGKGKGAFGTDFDPGETWPPALPLGEPSSRVWSVARCPASLRELDCKRLDLNLSPF